MSVKKRFLKLVMLVMIFVFLNMGAVSAYTWEQVGQNNFGGPQNQRITRLIEFNGALYAIIQNMSAPNTTTQVWRSADGANWTQSVGYPVNYTLVLFNDAEVFNGYLYVAQSNGGVTDEAYIYRTADGVAWSASVIPDGFGDANNVRIVDLKTVNGYLYATTFNLVTGTEVWRSQTGDPGSWNQVVDTGFGDANNLTAGIDTYNGSLYAGTTNVITGAEIWASPDGSLGSWTQIGVDGLNPIEMNYGIAMSVPFKGAIYFLSYANFDAPRMWRSTDGATISQVASTGLEFKFAGDEIAIGTTGLVVGDNLWLGMSDTTSGARLKYSSDGANWTQEGQTGFGNANNTLTHPLVYFNNNIYIAFDNTVNGAQMWRTAAQTLPYTGGRPEAKTTGAPLLLLILSAFASLGFLPVRPKNQ